MYIGITDADKLNPNKNICDVRPQGLYAYSADQGYAFCYNRNSKIKKNLPRFNVSGYILTMKLTLGSKNQDRTLSFRVNDGYEFTIYSNLKVNKNLNYRLAISIYEDDLYAEIIN